MIKLLIIATVVAAAFGVYYFKFNKSPSISVGGIKILAVNIRNKTIEVEVADNLLTRKQGLSDREALGEDQGMLFIYTEAGNYSFWMKDMKFPIDIIWIDENYKVIDITKNILPDTFPQSFQPAYPVKYVLEVNANWADRNFIRVGDLVSF